ncbi:solute carrier family 35 member F5-like [Portunus trituberculatus]|uniref:solute carrier family 35 member F5-like n=1 Tax=Portunus trituberculatus TaxID=210409 RepID=UPI001E1CBB15|nr:solute carrier family 35 member F5-like [Portunus trituberculatus]
MTHGRRLALGIFILLLVDVIWVASSELSEYIFNNTGFDKPFFSTYLKTSMFSLYLLGFIFWRPWRHQCSHSNHDERIYQEVDANEDEGDPLSPESRHLDLPKWMYIWHFTTASWGNLRRDYADFPWNDYCFHRTDLPPASIFTVDQVASSVARDTDEGAQLTHLVLWRYLPIEHPQTFGRKAHHQSEPSYVPLKLQESHEKSSDGESDDSSVKSVRFSKLTEVRQMSESDAVDAMLSRLSFSASIRAEQLALQQANKLSIKEVMKISCIFCLLWFAGNYAYQIALSDTEAGVVNVISSASGLFTLILAAIFPSSVADKFTISKLISVLLMVVGVGLISLEDISLEGKSVPVGVIWALAGAVLYACYMVFLKWRVPTEDQMDFTMFFGFVGLFNAIILWPGFPLLDVIGWEPFQLPNLQQLLYMSVNGLVGTVLSELLWLWVENSLTMEGYW